MINANDLNIGDTSENGQVTIIDEDRLCYLVKSTSRGAIGLRTISKALLKEFVAFIDKHPEVPANEVRFKISGQSDIDKYEYGYGATISVMAKMILGQERILRTTGEKKKLHVHPFQQIFYGAPGTGKSHSVCEVTKNLPKEDVFRITFHPDSDYASFVGCYKPTETEGFRYGINGANTVKMVDPDNGGAPLVEKKITYRFVPQAFINAYVRAYHTDSPVFLVIEEINRGNCAQIFGDMFQLLDRGDSGESDYAIKPDSDIQDYLSKVMADAHTDDEAIKSGEEMKLPANLYIWATMNTSDQSLFPIDSAFKRRWDWKYMPIDTTKEQWAIKVNGKDYSWGSFLDQVNDEIGETTSSEDKKLGFYFCKASDKTITAERFVSKVLFYIYNDVFKDYGLDSREFFKDKETGKVITFQSLFNMDGSIKEPQVEKILTNLKVEASASTLTPKDDAEEEGNQA